MKTMTNSSHFNIFRVLAYGATLTALLPFLPAIALMHFVAYMDQRKSVLVNDSKQFEPDSSSLVQTSISAYPAGCG